MSSAELLRVPSTGGWSLAVEHLAPSEPFGRVAILGHAMFCGRRSMDRPRGRGLASTLAEHGFDVLLYDTRGHGDSGPRASRSVDWTYDDVVDDIAAVARFAGERFPGRPLVMVGHSLCAHAGMVTLSLYPELPVAAAVSFGGNTWLRAHEPDPVVWRRKQRQIAAFRAVTEVFGYFPTRRLGIGPDDEARTYVRHFTDLVFHDRWSSADGRVHYGDHVLTPSLPLLSLVGVADDLECTPASGEAFVRQFRNCDVTHITAGPHTFPGLPHAPNHMTTVTDPRSRLIWEYAARWMADVTRGA